MECENERTTEGTKIRAIPKRLNWDMANEKVNCEVLGICQSLLWGSSCAQIPAAGGANWDQGGSASCFQSFWICGLLINNKRENNSGNLYSNESFLSLTRSHKHRTYWPGIIAGNQRVAAGNHCWKTGRHLKSEAVSEDVQLRDEVREYQSFPFWQV